MKTFFSLRRVAMTLLLTGCLLSCQDDALLRKGSDPLLKGSELQTTKEKGQETPGKLEVAVPITKEMEDRVIEAVKPVKEIVGKILEEDKTGTFEAYKKDVEKFNSLKSLEEKEVFVKELYSKYVDFFKQVWKKADIDEPYYQKQIRDAFPDEMRDDIEFTDFLNFSTRVQKNTRDNNPPAPAPPPAPGNICVDAITLAFGIKQIEISGLATATGTPAHSYVNASAAAEFAGLGRATVGTAANITIPGTFPSDDRVLRVKKSFDWRGYIFALTVFGCSFSSVQYTTIMNEEFIRLWAPVIFVNHTNFDVHRTEEYLIQKRFMYNVRYGVSVYSDSFAEILAGTNSSSSCDNFSWHVCEEKKPD